MCKNNNRKFIIASLISLLVIPFTLSLGQARWNLAKEDIVGFNDIFTEEVRSSTPVAYVDTNDADHQYYTIEGALKAAKEDTNSNTIYVIPAEAEGQCNTVSILHDCEIAAGDTLMLPYSGETAITANRNATPNVVFSDQNAASVSKYRRLNVVLKSKLTNNGSLIVGGELGTCSPVIGQTVGRYAQMTLEANGQISNLSQSSVIQCHGYIKEAKKNNESKIDLKLGTLIEPMVFYDFGGGSHTGDLLKGGVFPFYQYDFPNITVSIEISERAQVDGITDVYVSGQHAIFENIHLLGNNGLFKIGERGSIIFKHCGLWREDDSYTSNNDSELIEQITDIFFNGDVSLTSLTIDFGSSSLGIAGAGAALVAFGTSKIVTSNYFFPIPFNIRMSVSNGGHLTCLYDMKFLPGSSLMIEENGSVDFQKKAIFYTSSANANLPHYPSSMKSVRSATISKGRIVFRSAAGGYIYAEEGTALLGVTSSNSVECPELNASNSSTSHSEQLIGNVLQNDGLYVKNVLVEQGYYKAKANSDEASESDFYWNATSEPCVAIINVEGDNTYTSYGKEGLFTLNASIEPEQPSDKAMFYQWKVDGVLQAEQNSSTYKDLKIEASTGGNIDHLVSLVVTTTDENGNAIVLDDTEILTARRIAPSIVSFSRNPEGDVNGSQTIIFTAVINNFEIQEGDLADLSVERDNILVTSTYELLDDEHYEIQANGQIVYTRSVSFKNEILSKYTTHKFHAKIALNNANVSFDDRTIDITLKK